MFNWTGFAQWFTSFAGWKNGGKNGSTYVTATEFADRWARFGAEKVADHCGKKRRGNKDENLSKRASARMSTRAFPNGGNRASSRGRRGGERHARHEPIDRHGQRHHIHHRRERHHGTASDPASFHRIASYNVVFPAAGNYDLYVRIYAGPVAAKMTAFIFRASDSTTRTGAASTTRARWIYESHRACLRGRIARRGDTGRQVGVEMGPSDQSSRSWRWPGPNAWVVPAGSLTQTFYWASREDGLFFDKFAFGPAGHLLHGGASSTPARRAP